MKKALITVSLVAIATVVLLFCFRAISGAEEKSLDELEYIAGSIESEAAGAQGGEDTNPGDEVDDIQGENDSLKADLDGANNKENGQSDVDLRAEEIKEYIKERVIPVVVGVLTSLSAVLASLGAIKKSLVRLSGARDDFKNEASERKSEFARQSALLESKAQELSTLASLIPQLERELTELKNAQDKLSAEAYNIGKMISLGFSGSQTVIRSGNGRKISALLSECRALSGKNGEDKGECDLTDTTDISFIAPQPSAEKSSTGNGEKSSIRAKKRTCKTAEVTAKNEEN